MEKRPTDMSLSRDSISGGAQFAAILSEAARQYKETSPGTIDDYLNPPIRNIEDLQHQLDAQNFNFSKFREKRQAIFSGLAATFKPVELVGDIAAGAVSEVFPPSQTIFGAVAYLIGAADNVSSTYDSIVALFEQLKDMTARLEVYVQYDISPALRQKVVTILATLFEILVLTTKEVRRGRFRAYVRRLRGADNPIEDAVERLKALTLGEERQALTDTYGGVMQINTKTDRVEDLVQQMKLDVQNMRSENRSRYSFTDRERLRTILRPSPYPEDIFKSANRARLKGTGDWLLSDQGFRNWVQGDKRYLWISGATGTGKSFLTTRLISWAGDNLHRSAYFFFQDTSQDTRSVSQALRDVAYQMSESDPYYAHQLSQSLFGPEDIKTISSAWRRLFLEPFKGDTRGRPMYIFLDGIDEAETEEIQELLGYFEVEDTPAEEKSTAKIQIALVGRSYMTELVTTALDPTGRGYFTTVHITPDRNAQDVHTFIVDGVYRSKNLGRSGDDFKQMVIKAMDQQVDGLFILAKFMLEDFNGKSHRQQILQSVKTFPKEINGMLNRACTNLAASISEEEALDLNEMLRWVACAEESLTLEQLEAVLCLEFGDSPLRFEEKLRGQYSCFFELERQDGLTTDDLAKDFERKQREDRTEMSPGVRPGRRLGSDPSISPANSDKAKSFKRKASVSPNFVGRRRLSSEKRFSPTSTPTPEPPSFFKPPASNTFRPVSPPGTGLQGLGLARFGTSPAKSGGSPVSYSPISNSSLSDDYEDDVEFQSNKTTTRVQFFHSTVREFFRNPGSPSISTDGTKNKIGFNTREAKTHVLKICLRMFTDPEWFDLHMMKDRARQATKQYAAWYWQEHLLSVDPKGLENSDKMVIGAAVYKMLTDEAIILEWTTLYMDNDGGLEVLSDKNIQGIRTWMSDAVAVSSLSPKAQAWALQAASTAAGIVEPIGRFYAKIWLHPDTNVYRPTTFCFQIVQNMALLDTGCSWSNASSRWSEMPLRDRMHKAVEWSGHAKTGHLHRRVGSTYLMQEDNEQALSHYREALELDDNSAETSGRIAYCLYRDNRFEAALDQALACVRSEEKKLESARNIDEPALSRARWRFYKDQFLVARCYAALGALDDALVYFKKAITSSERVELTQAEVFESQVGYLKVLSEENRHREIMDLMENMSEQITTSIFSHSRLADLLLDQYNKPLAMAWIPKAASKTGKVDFLVDQLETCVDVAHTIRDPLRELYLRLTIGATNSYSGNMEAAIAVFEQLTLVEYRPRGNIPTRQGHTLSMQRLSALYKQKLLHVGHLPNESSAWLEKLERLQMMQASHQNLDMPPNMLGSDVNVGSIYLALFYRLMGREEEAKALLGRLILESLDILSDADQENDEYGLENLLRVFIAAGDVRNATALAQSMRKVDPNSSTLSSGSSPDLPSHRRLEPKLPEIQSATRACAQCLDNIPPPATFHICLYCMEPYCALCMRDLIRVPGNTTPDLRGGVQCRSDHDWMEVAPLRKLLHRGEILFAGASGRDGAGRYGDGDEVRSFSEWKEDLQKMVEGDDFYTASQSSIMSDEFWE